MNPDETSSSPYLRTVCGASLTPNIGWGAHIRLKQGFFGPIGASKGDLEAYWTMSRVDELKRVGNLTMTDLVRLGKVAIGPGFGARFREAMDEQVNGSAEFASNGAAPAKLVLVADDDSDILALLRIVLEEDGYDVIEAADGEEAATMTLSRRPDLCVLDAGMNGMDGLQVTRILRAADQSRDVPIVLTSTHPRREDADRAKAIGASYYLTKPFVPDELQRSVRELLAA